MEVFRGGGGEEVEEEEDSLEDEVEVNIRREWRKTGINITLNGFL